ncbi:50S ribosomal protein L36 [Candidatus Hodgkinia cicadicola]|nr:50S ribosomal protein L36 [Candidatus Hodgkinia cicadicola]
MQMRLRYFSQIFKFRHGANVVGKAGKKVSIVAS